MPEPGWHNYDKMIAAAKEELVASCAGHAIEATVAHDSWCDLLVVGGLCNCKPDVVCRCLTCGKSGVITHG